MLSYFGCAAIFWLLAFSGIIALVATIFTIKETLPKAARISAKQSHPLKGYGVLLHNRSFQRLNLSGSLFAYISGSPFALRSISNCHPHISATCLRLMQ